MVGSGKIFDSNTDIPDLSGKVILVTGGERTQVSPSKHHANGR